MSAQECFLALLGVSGEIMESIELHLSRHKTSQGRIRVLLEPATCLRESPGRRCPAQKLGVTPATVTGLIDGLERTGQVRRERQRKDRRGVQVRLTPRGAKFLAEVMP